MSSLTAAAKLLPLCVLLVNFLRRLERSRERNRRHAKSSRERKKCMVDTLQRQNIRLKVCIHRGVRRCLVFALLTPLPIPHRFPASFP